MRQRIADAARRGGRDPGSVRLIAVSKTQPAAAVLEAHQAGQVDFGENRVQEALDKMAGLPATLAWHLIGHLQTNKARLVPGAFACVHSLDSERLARELERHAAARGLRVPVLLQINLSGEASKSGLASPEEARVLLAQLHDLPHLQPIGLMTIPDPAFDEPRTRALFARLRELLEALRRQEGIGPEFRELSMGMSHDYAWAIEEGATLVRVGSAIFGPRP
ncbi:MAG TPA: YggS family pyridoxal phosphate-dependent enzyme [bacterium]|nr:YggS family pyridoxal phosphate-dependent enzyme [bacterium]